MNYTLVGEVDRRNSQFGATSPNATSGEPKTYSTRSMLLLRFGTIKKRVALSLGSPARVNAPMFPYCPGVQRPRRVLGNVLWKEVMTLPNTPQSLDRFERLLETLEFPGKSGLRLVTATLAIIATLGTWFVHLNHPLLPRNSDAGTWIWMFIVAFAPPFMTVLCIGFSLAPPKIKNQIGKLPISTSIENPTADRRRKVMLVAGVFGAANYLLMLATSHV